MAATGGKEKKPSGDGSGLVTQRRGHEAPDSYFGKAKGDPEAEARIIQKKLKEETGIEHDLETIKNMRESVNDYSSGDYTAIRAAQSGEIKKPSKAIQLAAQDLDKFVEISPKFQSPPPLARGIKVSRDSDILSGLKDGAVIDMRGTSSWTSNKDIAYGFATGGEVPVIFQLSKTNIGTSIKHLSAFPKEDEVLMHSKAKFKIISVKQKKFGSKLMGQKEGFIVELEELPIAVGKSERFNEFVAKKHNIKYLTIHEKWDLDAIAITDENGNVYTSK